MRIRAKILKLHTILVGIVILTSCGPDNTRTSYFETDGFYNGMVYRVVYRDTLRRDLALPVDSVVWEFAKSMSAVDTGSILSRLNRNDSAVILSELIIRAVRNMHMQDSLSGGLLPMNTGTLKERWGLHGKKLKTGWRAPDQKETDSLLQIMRAEQVQLFTPEFKVREVGEEQRGQDQKYWLENIRIRRNAPLDLSSITRGALVDMIAEYLELEGISDYSVQVDQVVRTAGREYNSAWKVALERPELGEEIIFQQVLELQDQSISTAGFTRRAISTPAGDFLPIIDPRSGKPVELHFCTYSVIAEDASTADMLSNICSILGKDKALKFAGEKGIELFIMERSETGEIQTFSTLKPARKIMPKE